MEYSFLMGRARGTKKDRGTGEPAPGRGAWPPELQDLQRRGGMSPDWHEAAHGRGSGVADYPERSLVDILVNRKNLRDAYPAVLREIDFEEVLPTESYRSLATIFDLTYSLSEEAGKTELRNFLNGIATRKSISDINREIRKASLKRIQELIGDMQVTSADVIEAGAVQGVLQRAAEEFEEGPMSQSLRNSIERVLRNIEDTEVLSPTSRATLKSALLATAHLGFDNLQSNGRINYYASSLRHMLSIERVLGSPSDPLSMPYWEIWKEACGAS